MTKKGSARGGKALTPTRARARSSPDESKRCCGDEGGRQTYGALAPIRSTQVSLESRSLFWSEADETVGAGSAAPWSFWYERTASRRRLRGERGAGAGSRGSVKDDDLSNSRDFLTGGLRVTSRRQGSAVWLSGRSWRKRQASLRSSCERSSLVPRWESVRVELRQRGRTHSALQLGSPSWSSSMTSESARPLPFLASLLPFEPASVEDDEVAAEPLAAPEAALDEDAAPADEFEDDQSRLMDESMLRACFEELSARSPLARTSCRSRVGGRSVRGAVQEGRSPARASSSRGESITPSVRLELRRNLGNARAGGPGSRAELLLVEPAASPLNTFIPPPRHVCPC